MLRVETFEWNTMHMSECHIRDTWHMHKWENSYFLKYQGLLGMGKNIDLLLRCYVCGAVKFTIHGKKLSAGIVVCIPFTW